MTTVEPATADRAHRQDEPFGQAHRAISHDELTTQVRQLRAAAYRSGRRIPGRPALAQQTGASAYRVRRALEEIARHERSTREFSRPPAAAAVAPPNGVVPTRPAVTDEPTTTGGVRHGALAGERPIEVTPTGATPTDQATLDNGASQRNRGADMHDPITKPAATQDTTARNHHQRHSTPAGARGFYLTAFMSMLVSVDTSWRFFGHILHITDTRERLVMFAVMEVALIACGYGMRTNVHRCGHPGAPRLFAWLLCGLSGYMAWQLSGMVEGLARVALGPALGLVMLHLALGIEIRAGAHARMTTWARIARELRERLQSRLGLSDDERDALARTRDCAARRVAKLSLGNGVWFRDARVARALRASNVAHDPSARTRMLAELAAIRHASDLATLPQPSPWLNPATDT